MNNVTVRNDTNSNSTESLNDRGMIEKQQQDYTPEFVQRKIYFLMDQLKEMHSELPETLQTRISYELLTEVANCVLNESIFDIVKALMELQHVSENHLMQMRTQVENEFEFEMANWRKKIKDPEELQHILGLLKVKHNKKLMETDKIIIEALDQKVLDQQSMLQKAGVPGFYVTMNPREIKIQMFLLDFILRLSLVKFEPNNAHIH